MEQISLLGGHETEYQLTQKLKYAFQKMRKVKNNGAILIIVWNILLLSVHQYLLFFVAKGLKEGPIAWGVTLSIVGWMINIFVRRYKVIQWSIWIMWITSILATLNLTSQPEPKRQFDCCSYITTLVSMCVANGYHGLH